MPGLVVISSNSDTDKNMAWFEYGSDGIWQLHWLRSTSASFTKPFAVAAGSLFVFIVNILTLQVF